MTALKPGARYPSGQRRATPSRNPALKAALDASKALDVKSVVLMQPHRGGRASGAAIDPRREAAGKPSIRKGIVGTDNPLASTALGRFCIAMDLPSTVYAAGSDYAALYGKWRAAWGAPRGAGTPGDTPSRIGEGPTMEAAKKWEAKIKAVNKAVADAHGPEAVGVVNLLILGEIQVTAGQHDITRAALYTIAVELGHIASKDHPFR